MPSGRHISAGAKSDDIVYLGAILVPPIPVESVMGDSGLGRRLGKVLQNRSPVLRCVACRAHALPL